MHKSSFGQSPNVRQKHAEDDLEELGTPPAFSPRQNNQEEEEKFSCISPARNYFLDDSTGNINNSYQGQSFSMGPTGNHREYGTRNDRISPYIKPHQSVEIEQDSIPSDFPSFRGFEDDGEEELKIPEPEQLEHPVTRQSFPESFSSYRTQPYGLDQQSPIQQLEQDSVHSRPSEPQQVYVLDQHVPLRDKQAYLRRFLTIEVPKEYEEEEQKQVDSSGNSFPMYAIQPPVESPTHRSSEQIQDEAQEHLSSDIQHQSEEEEKQHEPEIQQYLSNLQEHENTFSSSDESLDLSEESKRVSIVQEEDKIIKDKSHASKNKYKQNKVGDGLRVEKDENLSNHAQTPVITPNNTAKRQKTQNINFLEDQLEFIYEEKESQGMLDRNSSDKEVSELSSLYDSQNREKDNEEQKKEEMSEDTSSFDSSDGSEHQQIVNTNHKQVSNLIRKSRQSFYSRKSFIFQKTAYNFSGVPQLDLRNTETRNLNRFDKKIVENKVDYEFTRQKVPILEEFLDKKDSKGKFLPKVVWENYHQQYTAENVDHFPVRIEPFLVAEARLNETCIFEDECEKCQKEGSSACAWDESDGGVVASMRSGVQLHIEALPILVDGVQQMLVTTWEQREEEPEAKVNTSRIRKTSRGDQFNYFKTLRVYDHRMDNTANILCENIFVRQQLAWHEPLALHQDNDIVYYWKRIYEEEEVQLEKGGSSEGLIQAKEGSESAPGVLSHENTDGQVSYLQLFSLDLNLTVQGRVAERREARKYSLRENLDPRTGETNLQRVFFSQEFGSISDEQGWESLSRLLTRGSNRADRQSTKAGIEHARNERLSELRLFVFFLPYEAQRQEAHCDSEELQVKWNFSVYQLNDMTRPVLVKVSDPYAKKDGKSLDAQCVFHTRDASSINIIVLCTSWQLHLTFDVKEAHRKKKTMLKFTDKLDLREGGIAQYPSPRFEKKLTSHVVVYCHRCDPGEVCAGVERRTRTRQFFTVSNLGVVVLLFPPRPTKLERFGILEEIAESCDIHEFREPDELKIVRTLEPTQVAETRYVKELNVRRSLSALRRQLNRAVSIVSSSQILIACDQLDQQMIYVFTWRLPVIDIFFMLDRHTEDATRCGPAAALEQTGLGGLNIRTRSQRVRTTEDPSPKLPRGKYQTLQQLQLRKQAETRQAQSRRRHVHSLNSVAIARRCGAHPDHDDYCDKRVDQAGDQRLVLKQKRVAVLKREAAASFVDEDLFRDLHRLSKEQLADLEKRLFSDKKGPSFVTSEALALHLDELEDKPCQQYRDTLIGMLAGYPAGQVSWSDFRDDLASQFRPPKKSQSPRRGGIATQLAQGDGHLLEIDMIPAVDEEERAWDVEKSEQLSQIDYDLARDKGWLMDLITLVHVQRNETHFVFAVSVTNVVNKPVVGTRRKSYLFVTKTILEVKQMINWPGEHQLIDPGSEYDVIVHPGVLKKMDLQTLRRLHQQEGGKQQEGPADESEKKGDILNQEGNSCQAGCEYRDIKLHFESLVEPLCRGLKHLAFVYAEYLGQSTGQLMFYNIAEGRIEKAFGIAERASYREYIYTGKLGLNCTKLCRVSDVLEGQEKGKDGRSVKLVNYQVFNFFILRVGMVEVQEVQFRFSEGGDSARTPDARLVGWKNLYFSKEMIDTQCFDDVLGLEAFSYTRAQKTQQSEGERREGQDLRLRKLPQGAAVAKRRKSNSSSMTEDLKDSEKAQGEGEGEEEEPTFISGSQLVFHLSNAHSPQHRRSAPETRVLNLIEGDGDNQYGFESEIILVGQKKVLLDAEPDLYVVVVAARLRDSVVEQGCFTNAETQQMLKWAIQIQTVMKIPDLQYLVLNDFDTMCQKDFFANQAFLHGLSICELCLVDQMMIQKQLENFKRQAKHVDLGLSVLERILEGDGTRKQALLELEVFPAYQILSHDFNMDTTLYRCLQLGAIKSLKYLIEFVFEQQALDCYDHIMFDLPALLEQDQLDVTKFFGEPKRSRRLKTLPGCNIRKPLESDKFTGHSDVGDQVFIVEKGELKSHLEKDAQLIEMVRSRAGAEPAGPAGEDRSLEGSPEPEQELDEGPDPAEDPSQVVEEDAQAELGQDKGDAATGEQARALSTTESRTSAPREDLAPPKGTVPVEQWYIDFDYLVLGEKVKRVTGRSDRSKKTLRFDDEYYSRLVWLQNENDSFFRQNSVQRLVAHLFVRTKAFYTVTFVVHVLLFLIPFTLSVILGRDDPGLRLHLYYVCLGAAALSVQLELYSFLVQGWNYFSSRAFLEVFHLALFGYLFYQDGLYAEEADEQALQPVVILTIFLAYWKAAMLMQVFEEVSYFMKLVLSSLREIRPLLATYLIFQVFFTLCYAAMEIDLDEQFKDAGRIGYGSVIFALCWFNSLSKLKFVMYGYSLSHLPASHWLHRTVHIEIVWALYYIHIMTMFTMMLNFMVTVIDVAYRGIANFKDVHMVRNKARLNRDFYELAKYLRPGPEYCQVVFQSEVRLLGSWDNDAHAAEQDITSQLKEHLAAGDKLRATEELLRRTARLRQQLKGAEHTFEKEAGDYLRQLATFESHVSRELKDLQDSRFGVESHLDGEALAKKRHTLASRRTLTVADMDRLQPADTLQLEGNQAELNSPFKVKFGAKSRESKESSSNSSKSQEKEASSLFSSEEEEEKLITKNKKAKLARRALAEKKARELMKTSFELGVEKKKTVRFIAESEKEVSSHSSFSAHSEEKKQSSVQGKEQTKTPLSQTPQSTPRSRALDPDYALNNEGSGQSSEFISSEEL